MAFTYYFGDRIVGQSSDGFPTGIMDGAMLTHLDTYTTYIKSGTSTNQTYGGLSGWFPTNPTLRYDLNVLTSYSAGTIVGVSGFVYSSGSNKLMVYVNGMIQRKDTNASSNDYDYYETNVTGVDFTYAIPTGSLISFIQT